uniref:Phosphoribosyltransferase domain-containing protein n=1 Tax=Bornetia secundiflora TaxID=2575637 RepID=A0A4D6WMY8_9FLOR|nr:hypothetical protein [Bornetia secundiflora]
MQLNIYLISHPIIKLLSSSIVSSNTEKLIAINQYKNLGLLLIYEITRKYIQIQTIYIKNINTYKEISLLKPYQHYYIFTNLQDTYKMLSEIELIVPNIQIFDIEYKNISAIQNDQNLINNFIHYEQTNTQIIILDNVLKESHIIQLIKYLNLYKAIPISRIHIACIACYNHILNIIGMQYPELKIYTTKIIK